MPHMEKSTLADMGTNTVTPQMLTNKITLRLYAYGVRETHVDLMFRPGSHPQDIHYVYATI